MEGRSLQEPPQIGRRVVLRLAAMTGAAALLSSCAAPPTPTAAPTAPPTESVERTAPPPTALPKAAEATVAPPKPKAEAPTQPPPKPKTLRMVEFRLDWMVIGYQAPFWAGVERGYFADQGIDLKLFEGQGSASTFQIIASGQQPIGMFDAGVMVQGVQKGVELKMVGGVLQRNLYGIISPADAPITKPDDLRGKKLAGFASSVGELQLPGFLKRVGIPESAVTFVNTDATGKYAALMARRVDGAIHQVPTDAIAYEGQNFAVQRLLYVDYGLVRLCNGIVASNKMIKDSPDLVRGVLAGLAKGWQYALERPTESTALGKKFFSTNLSDDTLEKQWKAIMPFQRTDRTKDKPLFWMDKQDWEDTQNLLRDTNYVPETRPVETYYTNEFLP